MSTAQERLDIIKNNYLQALQNEPHDLAQTQTAAQVTAVQANVAAAARDFFTAAAAVLSNEEAGVEAAFTAASAALSAVQQARAEAEAIPALLGKLNGATSAATDLLHAASKAIGVENAA